MIKNKYKTVINKIIKSTMKFINKKIKIQTKTKTKKYNKKKLIIMILIF